MHLRLYAPRANARLGNDSLRPHAERRTAGLSVSLSVFERHNAGEQLRFRTSVTFAADNKHHAPMSRTHSGALKMASDGESPGRRNERLALCRWEMLVWAARNRDLGDEMFQTKIGHAHLFVSDLARSVAFYQRYLNLTVTEEVAGMTAFLSGGDPHHPLRGGPAARPRGARHGHVQRRRRRPPGGDRPGCAG